jgi:Ca2+-binding EF-hand superfamily protein
LREILGKGKKIEDKVWEQMITEVDINGDGEISYEEFEKIMEKLFKD